MNIGMVGHGEVGGIFAAGLKPQAGVDGVSIWDIRLQDPTQREAALAKALGQGVVAVDSMQALCQASDLIISAVTASNTLAVAEEAARHIRPGTVFLDLNSASPGTKQQAAQHIEARGGRYVEAGVMTSVPPYGMAVPMLLGGPHAAVLAPVLLIVATFGCLPSAYLPLTALRAAGGFNPFLRTQRALTGEQWANLAVTSTVWILLPLAVGLTMVRRSEVS